MAVKKYLYKIAGCVGILFLMTYCVGCSEDRGLDSDGLANYGGIPSPTQEAPTEEIKRYNTEETVVLTKIDATNEKIYVKRPDESAQIVLSYNGGTVVKSKYGNNLVMEQLGVGEIVKVSYATGTQKLIEIAEYDGSFENNIATRWRVDYEKKLITIGSKTYTYDDNIFLTSDGKNVDIREISGMDELTVRGVGSKVYSVCVNKGHGYVKLTNTVNYIGGVVEIGDRIMTVITSDMIIAAPEGQYKLTATINGTGGSKEITVVRGQETVVSLGSFEQSVTRYGSVRLSVVPDDAQAILTIDGEQMDYSELMSLSYGNHKMVLKSNNYDTVVRDITISSVYCTINVDMRDESQKETEDETTSKKEEETTDKETESESSSNIVNVNSSNNLINITAPLGAKVYFDGSYIGVAPLSFQKISGEHTILFKKDGYVTKSYTIDVSDDTEDMILSFPQMQKE